METPTISTAKIPTNFNLKNFVSNARSQKIPDEQIYKYLEGKNLLPQGQNYTSPIQPKTTDMQPQSTPAKALVGTTNFLGITKAGQGLATAGRVASGSINQTGDEESAAAKQLSEIMTKYAPGSPERKAAVTKFNDLYKGGIQTQGQIDPGTQLSNKEVIGSFGNVATNVIGAGLAAPKGATVAARLGEAGLKFGGLGVASGISEGLNQNESTKDIAKRAAISGVVSGGLGVGIQGLSELGKALTSPKVSEGLVNKSLGVPKKVIEAGRSPASEIVAQGQINSKRGFLAAAENTIKDSSSNINKALEAHTDLHNTVPLLDEIKNNLQGIYKDALSPQEVQGIVDNLPVSGLRENPAMSLGRINSLRSTIDNKYLGNSKWLMSALATQPEKVTALKVAANTLRDYVQTTAPETVPEFAKMSKALTSRTILNSTLAKPHILTNLIEMAASGGAGLASSGFSPKALLAAIGTFGATKAITSTPAVTALSAGLQKAGQASVGPVSQGIRTIARPLAQRAIQKLPTLLK